MGTISPIGVNKHRTCRWCPKGAWGVFNRETNSLQVSVIFNYYLAELIHIIYYNDVICDVKCLLSANQHNLFLIFYLKGLAFDIIITLNNIFISSPNSSTVVEVKEKNHDTIIAFSFKKQPHNIAT